MPDEQLLQDLTRFGPPLYVPVGRWAVAAVEHSNSTPDGVLVFGADGAVEVRTESSSRSAEPLSIRVDNVRMASAPRQGMDDAWRKVVVIDELSEVLIAGTVHRIQVLKSHSVFSFEVEMGDRTVRAAGLLTHLGSFAIERLDDVALSG